MGEHDELVVELRTARLAASVLHNEAADAIEALEVENQAVVAENQALVAERDALREQLEWANAFVDLQKRRRWTATRKHMARMERLQEIAAERDVLRGMVRRLDEADQIASDHQYWLTWDPYESFFCEPMTDEQISAYKAIS